MKPSSRWRGYLIRALERPAGITNQKPFFRWRGYFIRAQNANQFPDQGTNKNGSPLLNCRFRF